MRSRSSAALVALTLTACHGAPRPVAAPAPPVPGPLARLEQQIGAALAAPELSRAYWGVLVKSLPTGRTLYAHNPGRLLLPGSTMKVVTLAAAADRLGWSYTYETRLLAGAPIENGVLAGDLIAVGSGDPSIVDGDHLFDRWADALAARGIRAVAGRIVGDDNTFDDEAIGPGWTWEDLADRDGAPVGALQYNENVAFATITPAPDAGAPAMVTLAPQGHGFLVDNQVRTAPAGAEASVRVRRLAGSSRLELTGAVPRGGSPILRAVAVDNPTLFFVSALRTALLAHGIEVRGAAVDIDDLADPPSRASGELLVSHRSPPLSTLAVRLMKNSQNLYAETLLKTIGVQAGSPTWDAGLREARTILTAWGIPPEGLVQVDGSGLSRYNYVTPDTLVAVLAHVDAAPALKEAFELSLPIAGRDGTLAGRMRGTPAENNARAKSGTLANARSLAGYVTDADGDRLVFAIIVNNYGASVDAAVAAMDGVVSRLAQFTVR